eukprot:3536028-Alexandrium_andersonii.AAC.1
MSASLVGSEMCIRDRMMIHAPCPSRLMNIASCCHATKLVPDASMPSLPCLLYTSDAADDM